MAEHVNSLLFFPIMEKDVSQLLSPEEYFPILMTDIMAKSVVKENQTRYVSVYKKTFVKEEHGTEKNIDKIIEKKIDKKNLQEEINKDRPTKQNNDTSKVVDKHKVFSRYTSLFEVLRETYHYPEIKEDSKRMIPDMEFINKAELFSSLNNVAGIDDPIIFAYYSEAGAIDKKHIEKKNDIIKHNFSKKIIIFFNDRIVATDKSFEWINIKKEDIWEINFENRRGGFSSNNCQVQIKLKDDSCFIIEIDSKVKNSIRIDENKYTNTIKDAIKEFYYCLERARDPVPILTSDGTVLFGNYHGQIEWYVLDQKDNSIFLLSKNILDYIKFRDSGQYFHENYGSSRYWRNIYINKWLNEEFYYNTFMKDERDIILDADVTQSDFSFPSSSRYEVSRIFILNSKEVEKYNINKKSFLPEATEYARQKYVKYHGLTNLDPRLFDNVINRNYWVRPIMNDNNVDFRKIYFLDENGAIQKAPTSPDTIYGVRPCLWLKLDD